jgi:hypothetical protein
MMHWTLTPYDKHSDDGFGSMAHAFQASAEALLATERDSSAQRASDLLFTSSRGRAVHQIGAYRLSSVACRCRRVTVHRASSWESQAVD